MNHEHHITSCRLEGPGTILINMYFIAESETRIVFSNTNVYKISWRAEFTNLKKLLQNKAYNTRNKLLLESSQLQLHFYCN